MADYTFTPDHPYSGDIDTEKQLTNDLEDESEIRNTQGLTTGGTYSERYTMSGAEIASLMAFYKTRLETTSFTKLSYDPLDPTFDPEDIDDPAGPEETVRFAGPPKWTLKSPDEFTVTVQFKKLVNE